MNNIKIALSTASMPLVFDNRKKVRIAQRKGYDGVELLLTRRALKDMKGKNKFLRNILSLHQPFRENGGTLIDKLAFLDFCPFPAIWSYNEYLELSSQLEIPVVFHVNDSHFDQFDPPDSWCNDSSSIITLEFNTFGVEYDRSFKPKDFIKMVKECHCSICFDVGYAAQAGWDILRAFEELYEKVRIIHFYDIKKEVKGMTDKNLTPGQGTLPLKDLLQEVNALHWKGQMTLELLPQPLARHRESLDFVKLNLS